MLNQFSRLQLIVGEDAIETLIEIEQNMIVCKKQAITVMLLSISI